MIRSLFFIIVSLIAAHVVAAASFIAWLGISNRISLDRLEQVRDIFALTVEEQETLDKREQREAEAEEQRQIAADRPGTPPVMGEQRLRIIQDYQEVSDQQNLQIQRETQTMLDLLSRRREALEQQETEFQKKQEAWERMRRDVTALQANEQFNKTVGIYNSVKPDVAKSMMQALIAQGDTQQAVAYLDAMNPRKSNKVIAEFQGDDPTLAADLLERLRLLGIESQDEETLADAEP